MKSRFSLGTFCDSSLLYFTLAEPIPCPSVAVSSSTSPCQCFAFGCDVHSLNSFTRLALSPCLACRAPLQVTYEAGFKEAARIFHEREQRKVGAHFTLGTLFVIALPVLFLRSPSPATRTTKRRKKNEPCSRGSGELFESMFFVRKSSRHAALDNTKQGFQEVEYGGRYHGVPLPIAVPREFPP